jgi:hypothetical protein
MPDELGRLAQTLEIQQVMDCRWRRGMIRGCVTCAAHGDGGMVAIRKTNNEIRIGTSANTNYLDLLTAERMAGMNDGDKFRRRLGRTGSVLWASLRWKIRL